eukprot:6528768-Pyramimonas_sp.AAC.1
MAQSAAPLSHPRCPVITLHLLAGGGRCLHFRWRGIEGGQPSEASCKRRHPFSRSALGPDNLKLSTIHQSQDVRKGRETRDIQDFTCLSKRAVVRLSAGKSMLEFPLIWTEGRPVWHPPVGCPAPRTGHKYTPPCRPALWPGC